MMTMMTMTTMMMVIEPHSQNKLSSPHRHSNMFEYSSTVHKTTITWMHLDGFTAGGF